MTKQRSRSGFVSTVTTAQFLVMSEDGGVNYCEGTGDAFGMFLGELSPDQDQLLDTLIQTRLGYSLEDDGTPEAAIGIDAFKVFMTPCREDGIN